jgi:hypothetical protein
LKFALGAFTYRFELKDTLMATQDIKATEDYNSIGHWNADGGSDFIKNTHIPWLKGYLKAKVKQPVKGQMDKVIQRAIALSYRFYITSNASGQDVLREVTGYGRSEVVSNRRLLQFCRAEWDGLLDVAFDTPDKMMEFLPVVNSSLFYPVALSLVEINKGVYFNSYRPPYYVPRADVVKAIEAREQRPEQWQEFLERWFPDDFDCAHVLEGYIARLIHDPLNRPRWAMVMRSDQGTGKGFLTETVLPKLLGDANVNITSLDKLVGKFNGGQFSNKLIVLNETDNDRKATYTKLKDKITDGVITVESKYETPVSQPLFNGTFVFSNEDHPLYAEEGDRRFYVTPRLRHKADRYETQKFIAAFAEWLDSEDAGVLGWEILSSWFSYVATSQDYNGVDTFMISQDGNRVSDLIVSNAQADQEGDLVSGLENVASQPFIWRVKELREQYPHIKQAKIEQILRDAGYSKKEKNNVKGSESRPGGWAYKGYGTAGNPCDGLGDPSAFAPPQGSLR